MGEIMRTIVLALVALSFTATFAAPQAAEPGVKKKRSYSKTYAARSSRVNGSDYYERIAEKQPYGSDRWWKQMDFENRGGR
jgi:hypothetical protein